MRPVFRGNNPVDKAGNVILFKNYRNAAPILKDRLGKYCSYCELKFPQTHVEHIQPKSLEPQLENDWNNFLLACPLCNGIKNDSSINSGNLNDFFWPDKDNTFIPFVYEKDRAPQISNQLSGDLKKIAEKTLLLTGLDREPTHPKFNIRTDERWHERNTAWGKAERAKFNLQRQPTEVMREQIIDTATSTGFWSVWMTVFQDDADMRRRLIEAFHGTCPSCFDADTQPIQRPGGRI
ncbi:HNH endonuclease [Methylomonas sp. CM2]|uniref:HNH endonuclease n=1 Tax=Methylomonas sp. CM2 TaxID=3417647 RepID=UPI003CE8012C